MIGMTIAGAHGISWGFGSRARGGGLRLVTVPEGVEGADMENTYIDAVQLDGAIYTGTKVKQVKWSVEVHTRETGLTGDEVVSLSGRWRRSCGRGELITFGIDSARGGVRYQDVRRAAKFDPLDLDLARNAKYFRDKVQFMSDRGYFYKDDVRIPFAPADFSGASVSNDADLDAPVRFEITGPITSPTIGVGDEAVALTGAVIPAGTTWIVETDPSKLSITDKATGANRLRTTFLARGQIPFVWDTPAPAGEQVPVNISGTGTTSATRVVLVLPQRYVLGYA